MKKYLKTDWLIPRILMLSVLSGLGLLLIVLSTNVFLKYKDQLEEKNPELAEKVEPHREQSTGSPSLNEGDVHVARSRPAPQLETPAGANIFVELARQVVPSVVNISTVSRPSMGSNRKEDLFRKFFEDFFGQPPQERESPSQRAMSLGTGFIIDGEGLILTNNHVVADAEEIKVRFTEEEDEKPTDATVVGRDPMLDLALLKIKTSRELTPLNLGNSDEINVGEYVIAVGNPFGNGHSVTHGIISAKNRIAPQVLARYLQTDAPINPGNSGGPLVNLKGEVVGINNAIDARAQGIGFAIPINLVKQVLPQLKTKGTVARGYIGVLIDDMSEEVAGQLGLPKDLSAPFVVQVYEGEPADQAGVETYDAILEFNGVKTRNKADLIRAVTAVPVGETVEMKVNREGKEKTLSIKVTERPGTPKLVKAPPQPHKKKHAGVDVGMNLEPLDAASRRELGVDKNQQGLVVVSLAYEGPAVKAGLMRGDILVEVNRKPVGSVDQFYKTIQKGKSYLLRVLRPGTEGGVFMVLVLDLKEES